MTGEVTRVLQAIEVGDPNAAETLLPLVYDELRRLAANRMASGAAGHTLQPTALVHEAWLRLVGDHKQGSYQGRSHFFAAAAEAMRHLLVDRARRRLALRHGGGQQRLGIEDVEIPAAAEDEELVAVHEALERLAGLDPAKAELVKLRYFAGLTLSEVAAVSGISEPTAKRRWAMARAWLYNEIRGRG